MLSSFFVALSVHEEIYNLDSFGVLLFLFTFTIDFSFFSIVFFFFFAADFGYSDSFLLINEIEFCKSNEKCW